MACGHGTAISLAITGAVIDLMLDERVQMTLEVTQCNRGSRKLTERSAKLAERSFAFDAFRLLPERHLLLEGETPVRIGGRALEILTALVERPGELVRKDELIARAWPNVVVEEINLRVNVAALRKVLGDGQAGRRYVANVPGRGYAFVSQVAFESVRWADCVLPRLACFSEASSPNQIGPIGRTDRIDAIRRQLPQHRLFTLSDFAKYCFSSTIGFGC
jgi:DNA-binding winged helix-turn-helix (wHTH) protein